MKWLDGITDLMDMSMSKLWEIVKDREAWHATAHAVAKSQTELSDKDNSSFPSILEMLTCIFKVTVKLKSVKWNWGK